MTVQDNFSAVFADLRLDLPTLVFNSATQQHIEFAHLINRCGKEIARSHDWQALKKVHTITGDGSTKLFDLPPDYDHRVKGAQLWASDIQREMTFIDSADEWLGLQTRFAGSGLNYWTIQAGQIETLTALGDGITGKFAYTSNAYCQPVSGNSTNEFTENTDTFVLDETLLELALVWRWKHLQKEPFEVDHADYKKELQRLISRDKGTGLIYVGPKRIGRAKISDPWHLS